MSDRINIWGYSYDPATGTINNEQGTLQPYTFMNVAVLGTGGGMAFANPINFATRETAEKVLAYLQALAPGIELKLHESVWAAGPYARSAAEYGIETPSGTVMNAGLVANTIMRGGGLAPSMLRAELAMYGKRRED